MRIKNSTTFTTAELREVIRFVKPNDVSNFDIHFKNCGGTFRGRAYTKGFGYRGNINPLVIVSIGKAEKFPLRIKANGAYLPVDLYSRIEALVLVTAHELRHLWQAQHPKGWRAWGSRGQYSERDADAYAIRTLRAWRRSK